MAQVKFRRLNGSSLPTYSTSDNGTILFLEGSKEIYMGNGSWIKFGDGDNNYLDVQLSGNKLQKTVDGTTWTDVVDLSTLELPADQISFDNTGNDTDLASTNVLAAIKELEDAIATGGTGSVVTLEKQGTADSGYAATYIIKQGNSAVGGGVSGKINIPQDRFLKSVSYASSAPATAEGNSSSVTFPALRFEWQLDTDDLTAGDQVVTYVSIAELGATGTLTFDNSDGSWASTNGLLTTQGFVAEINKMNGSVASSNGTNVNVTVTQTNGKVTAVSVSDSSINSTDLSTAISGLGTATANSGNVIAGVGVSNGALTVTSEVALADVATSGDSDDVAYDNTNSGLTATDVQAALDELSTAATASKTTLTEVSATSETTADSTDFIKVVKTSPVAADGHFNYEVSTKGIKDYVASEIAALDTPAGGITSTGGSKVSINAVETDGVISAITVTETDIASASNLSNYERSLAEVVGAAGNAGSHTWTNTTNYNAGSSSANALANMLAIDTQVKANADAIAGLGRSYKALQTASTDTSKTQVVTAISQDALGVVTPTKEYVGNMAITGYTVGNTIGVAATDTVNEALGKLQYELTWIEA